MGSRRGPWRIGGSKLTQADQTRSGSKGDVAAPPDGCVRLASGQSDSLAAKGEELVAAGPEQETLGAVAVGAAAEESAMAEDIEKTV